MALSGDSIAEIEEWLMFRCKAAGIDAVDPRNLLDTLWANWDTVTSHIDCSAELVADREAEKQAKIAELNAALAEIEG